MIKVLNYFEEKSGQKIFEAALLKENLLQITGLCDIEFHDKFRKDIDIANFISLDNKNTTIIRHCVQHSIPTLLWLFYANKDDASRIIEFKEGAPRISQAKLTTINMMDAVIAPSNEARIILRQLFIKIPIFVIPSAANPNFYADATENTNELFTRYFRIDREQKYTISVINLKAAAQINRLVKIAKALPEYKIFCFVSANQTLGNKLRLRRLKHYSVSNLIVSMILPEDVYRSGVANANYFIEIGDEKTSTLTLGEPMYNSVPIIINEKAIFSDIINENNALLIKDFKDVVKIIKEDSPHTKIIKKAKKDVSIQTFEDFKNAVCNLFVSIYLR